MNINQRIKELRKQLGYNQKDFGKKIGMGQAGVSWIEQDGNTVTDQNIRMICETFNISEHWLRTGDGDMKANDNRLYIRKLAQQYQLPDLHADVIEAWLTLTDAQRDALLSLMHELAERTAAAGAAREQNIPAASSPTPEESSAVPTVKESSTVQPSDFADARKTSEHTVVKNRFSVAARDEVPQSPQAIESELASYRAELEAQQKGQSHSAGTDATGENRA